MTLFRRVEPPDEHGGALPVVAIDRFEHVAAPESADPFSRAVVEFKAGEYAHWDRFRSGVGRLLGAGLRDAVVPGIATVFPGHAAGSLHGPLVELTSASVLDTPVAYEQRLSRVASVTRQRERPRAERWDALPAIRDSLAVRGPLEGRRVLLVDDVVVTGASLYAGARALREHGAGPVVGLALGMTDAPGTRRLAPDADLGAVLGDEDRSP